MKMKVKRSRKSVSWAPGVNFCQVKLFSSLDCPGNVGTKYQGQFQQNPSRMLHSSLLEANDSPPGFEVGISMKQSTRQHLPIPRIKWMCPAKLCMSENWCVVAGEESVEAKTQNTRQMAVLEAVYPRFSAIPPNSGVSFDVECERYDHSLTPCVPINPIEEESKEAKDHEFLTQESTTVVSQPPEFSQGLLVSKAENAMVSCPPGFYQVPAPRKMHNQCADFTPIVSSAALTAMGKSSEKESMIDTDLLIKILNDPKMIQKLINVQGPQGKTGTASLNTHTTPSSETMTSSVVSHRSHPDIQRTPGGNLNFQMPSKASATLNTIPLQPQTIQISGLKRSVPLPPRLPSADRAILPRLANQKQSPLSMLPHQKMAPLSSLWGPEIVKDMNYYKNLIRQHGTDSNKLQEPIFPNNGDNSKHLKMSLNSHPSEMKAKSLKRCIFFESADGCRKGANCEFLHDMSLDWRTGIEAQSAKRTKLNGVNNKGGLCFRI